MERSAVPPWLALMPLFAINPIAMAESSMEYPIAPATGATYLNVSPIMPTFVLALLDAAARTSANLVASLACIPNAVIASVTMSDVVAKSSPDAAARFRIPSIPPSISPVFHPAIAIKLNASADSLAVNCVEAPISFAFAVNFSKSFPVAPLTACTCDIAASKSLNVLIVSATPTVTPANAAAEAIGLETSPQTFLKGAVTRSLAFIVTVHTLPAIFFPADATPSIPLDAISFSVAATSSLLFPLMPMICLWRLIIAFSSLLTFSVALLVPLEVSSVTCATISITVTASLICACPLSAFQSSAQGLLLLPGLLQVYTSHTMPFLLAAGPYNLLWFRFAETVHTLSASGKFFPVPL